MSSEFWLETSRWIHIAAGTWTLLSGPMALLAKKGSKAHVFLGRSFGLAMGIVCSSALLNGIYKQMIFLCMIAVFTAYNTGSGYMALQIRKKVLSARSTGWVHALGAFSMLLFVGMGVWLMYRNQIELGILSLFFGGIGLANVWSFSKMFRQTLESDQLMRIHISGFVAGFIASLTAFSVQTMAFLPPMVQWLWPTFAFVPVIVFWTRKFSPRPAKA